MDDVTGSMLGILPPVIAAGAVTSIMSNMMPNGKGGGGMFGQGQGEVANPEGMKKIKVSTAKKLFGLKKVELARQGVRVSDADGDILFYENGSFYWIEG